MAPFKDFDGNEHWGIEIVDEYLVESIPDSERQDTTPNTVSVIESIESQPIKHPDTHDDGEGKNQDARQKLSGTSDSEVEAVVGAEKLLTTTVLLDNSQVRLGI
jgi:hypothetical protein